MVKKIIVSCMAAMMIFSSSAMAATRYGEQILSVGSRGDNVSRLQRDLRDLGYFNYASDTGYYGQITADAVSKFQETKGIKPNGTVGSYTGSLIEQSIAAKNVPSLSSDRFISVKVNGAPVSFPDAAPFLDENQRTQVPIRLVSEALGYKVDWAFDQNNKIAVTVSKGSAVISLKQGDKTAYINGKPIILDTTAFLKGDRTFVPLRFIAEAMGQRVDWDAAAYAANVMPLSAPAPAPAKTIIIDPGHGGTDPGATGYDGVTTEKEINYASALKVKAELEKRGYRVFLTRSGDADCTPSFNDRYEEFACRVNMAKDKNANIFISIHANAGGGAGAKGTEVYYNARNDWDGNENPYPVESEKLARAVYSSLIASLGTADRGLHNANYYVNRMAPVPSVLVETAFMTNAGDLAKLKDPNFQSLFASAMGNAIDSYFKSNP